MLKIKVKKSKKSDFKGANDNLDKKKQLMISIRMRKILSVFLIIMIICVSFYSGLRVFSLRHVKGEAEWRESNSQPYLYVSAENSYDLGYLTGQNLYKQIFSLKKILFILGPKYDISYSDLKKNAIDYIHFIPSEQLAEMNGIAKGATNKLGILITFNDILIQNTWFDILYGQIFPQIKKLNSDQNDTISTLNPIGCTAISALNNNNNPVYGQNFDFPLAFKDCTSFVLHKLGNRPAIFGIKFGAALNFPIGKNENNVSVLTTIIRTNVDSSPMIPTTCRARLALEQAKNASSYVNLFYDTFGINQSVSFCSIITDNTDIFAVDVVPNAVNIISAEDVVRTNTFVNESWQKYLVDKNYSKERQNEAERLLNITLEDLVLSHKELIQILQSTPKIFQIAENKIETATLAFITCKNYAIKNLDEKRWGIIPI
ncbi:MAG: C45 family autoproteolytic acyltransferase/hydrolase [Promethearchaeota archaeon]